MKKTISCLLAVLTVISVLLCFNACGSEKTDSNAESIIYENKNGAPVELGKGQKKFDLAVTHKDGSVCNFIISTDKSIVGEALEEIGLIEGTEGEFGLYIEKVNGITAKYEIDGTYWAFYIGNELSMVGIDQTEITDGAKYGLKVEG